MKKLFLILSGVIISLGVLAQDYSQLYMVGPATAAGWDNGRAVPMSLNEGSDAVFSWTGQMGTGQFKFLNASGSWSSSFTSASTDATVVLNQSFSLLFNDQSDTKFKIATAGLYKVTVDMKNRTMVVSEATISFPTSLWIVGTAVPNGKAAVPADPSGEKASFRYIGELIAGGTFQFISTETVNAETHYVVPTTDKSDILGTTNSQLVSTVSTAVWTVAASGTTYKIKIDGVAKTVKAENAPWTKLYMVGGATSADWTPADAIPFEMDPLNPYVFTFDGILKVGSANDPNKFKILGQNTDWNPNSLHPYLVDEPIIGSSRIRINGFDNKWIINSEEEGRYVIKVDLLYETILTDYKGSATEIIKKDVENAYTVISHKGSIEIQASADIQSAELIDLFGRTLDIKKDNTRMSFGDQVSAGIYLLKINGNTVQKVVIQ